MTSMQRMIEDNVLLSMLNQEPGQPKKRNIEDCEEEFSSTNRILSLRQERDLVDNLAFLASITDDPEKVIALCLEEGPKGDSCTVRLAINKGSLKEQKQGLDSLARIMEKADRESEYDNVERLLKAAISMDRGRLLARLRSKHARSKKKKGRKPPIVRLSLMVDALAKVEMLPEHVKHVLSQVIPTVTTLKHDFAELEALPSPEVFSLSHEVPSGTQDALLERLLVTADSLPSVRRIGEALDLMPSKMNDLQDPGSVLLFLTKLQKYRTACLLLNEASKSSLLFRQIVVTDQTIDCGPTPCAEVPEPLQACLKRNGSLATDETARRIGANLQMASTHFNKELLNLKPKIHAEIKLLLFYETHPNLKRPRVLCSSKSACFLCDLFVSLHGDYFMSRTHGVLYPKWTLPDLGSLELSKKRRQKLRRTIEELNIMVQDEIRRNLGRAKIKRLCPNESVASIQRWRDPSSSTIRYAGHASISNHVGDCEHLPDNMQEQHKEMFDEKVSERHDSGIIMENAEDGQNLASLPDNGLRQPNVREREAASSLSQENLVLPCFLDMLKLDGMELFFEFQQSAKPSVTGRVCSEADIAEETPIVSVDELQIGKELVLQSDDVPDEANTLILTSCSPYGKKRLWHCCWTRTTAEFLEDG